MFRTIYDMDATPIARLFWTVLLLVGIIFTSKNIHDCFQKYFSYPTITKTDLNHVSSSVTGKFWGSLVQLKDITQKKFVVPWRKPKKIRNLRQKNFALKSKSKFWSKIKIWSKIDILVKNPNFGKQSKFCPKIKILAKNPNLCPKSKRFHFN